MVTGAMANANRMVPGGDELVAVGDTAINILRGRARLEDAPEAFRESMGRQRGFSTDFAAENPRSAALARGTGMAATVAVPGGVTRNILAAGSRVGNMARGAITAGLTGAGYAAADEGTAEERLASASRAASDPLTLAMGGGAGALGPRATRKPKAPKAPTLDQLKAQKNAAYQAVDSAGVRYKPTTFRGFISVMNTELKAAKFNPMRHPKTASMLADIQRMRGQSPTLTELDQLRQVINSDVIQSGDKSEQRLGKIMLAQIDDFIDVAGPKQVTGGDPRTAATTIKRARDLNTRVRKVETVNEAVESARLRAGSTGSGGNVDNATRQNLRRVLQTQRNLTAEERKALDEIVMGGRGQNILRTVGKLSPQGNGLMTALSIGGAAANPILAVPTVGGAISKFAADAMTQRKVANLVKLMASGGKSGLEAESQLVSLAAKDPQVAALYRRVSAHLARTAGVAGAATLAPSASSQ